MPHYLKGEKKLMLKTENLFTEIINKIIGSKYIRSKNYIWESADGYPESYGQNLFDQRLKNNSDQPINDTVRDALVSSLRYKLKLNKTNKGTLYETKAIETANKLCDFLEGNNLFDCSELRNIQIMTEDPDNKHKREKF